LDAKGGEALQQWKFGLVIWLGLAWLPTLVAASMVDPAVVIERMINAYDGIHDYTALFLKRERINGVMQPLEKIELRFQEPFKVYMAWQEPDNGRVLTYVEGKNDNKILVNPGGLLQFMRMSLEPTSILAMRNEHHSILEVGIRNTIDLLKQQYERGIQRDEIDLRFRGHAEVDGRLAYHIEFVCSAKERDGYYAHRGEIWVDREYDLPIKLYIYDWDNQLYEHYEYRRLHLNPGLKPDAFDISGEAQAKPSTQTTEIASD
jgi:outer membrane lipoprotein-sorting protein